MTYIKLKKFLGKLFIAKTRRDELEEYIISKNVTSVEEVEYYTREFDRRGMARSVWW